MSAKQPLQGGPLQRAAGDAAVVVAVADQHPALGPLAGDIGLAGLALGVEGVELLLEPFLGGFAGVDGAAELADGSGLASCAPPLILEAEEDQPFQRVPVMARAMAESDL